MSFLSSLSDKLSMLVLIFANFNCKKIRGFNIEKYFAGIQFRENGQKTRNSRKNIPGKISTPKLEIPKYTNTPNSDVS